MFCNVASASQTETEGTRGDPGFMSCVETKRQQSFTKPGRVLLKLPCHVKDQIVRKSNQTNEILTLWDWKSGRPPVPNMRREFFCKSVWEHVGCWVRRCYIGLRSALRAGQSSSSTSKWENHFFTEEKQDADLSCSLFSTRSPSITDLNLGETTCLDNRPKPGKADGAQSLAARCAEVTARQKLRKTNRVQL